MTRIIIPPIRQNFHPASRGLTLKRLSFSPLGPYRFLCEKNINQTQKLLGLKKWRCAFNQRRTIKDHNISTGSNSCLFVYWNMSNSVVYSHIYIGDIGIFVWRGYQTLAVTKLFFGNYTRLLIFQLKLV